MLNRMLLQVVIAGLILTFDVAEISGRFPSLLALACMVTLYLAWLWLGPPSPVEQPPTRLKPMTSERAVWAQRLRRIGRLLWYVLVVFLALMLIATVIQGLNKQRHGSPASKEHSEHR